MFIIAKQYKELTKAVHIHNRYHRRAAECGSIVSRDAGIYLQRGHHRFARNNSLVQMLRSERIEHLQGIGIVVYKYQWVEGEFSNHVLFVFIYVFNF